MKEADMSPFELYDLLRERIEAQVAEQHLPNLFARVAVDAILPDFVASGDTQYLENLHWLLEHYLIAWDGWKLHLTHHGENMWAIWHGKPFDICHVGFTSP